MALEVFSYISSLVPANPTSTDPVSQGDDQIRGIKTTLVNSFPNVSAPVTATAAQLNSTALPQPVQMPIGGIIDFAGNTAPANYLLLPTTATNISRTTYAALFTAIGTTWGAGDGSNTFGMPYCPANYASIHAPGFVGVPSVGENLAHTHAVNPNIGAADGGTGYNNGWNDQFGATQLRGTTSSGGSANLPAGMRFSKCIRYQ